MTHVVAAIFNGTRAISNGVFLAASFAWQNAVGFKRTHDITNHTGNHVTNWPNGPVTIPAVTLITGADVPAQMAALSAGAVGDPVFATLTTSTAVAFGDAVAGSLLEPTNVSNANRGSALVGTYRCLGSALSGSGGATGKATLFRKIAA